MKKLIIGILVVLTLGCSLGGTVPIRSSADQCASYDDAYLGWSTAGMVTSGLAGAAGGAVALFPDNEDAQLGLGVSSAVLGAFGVAAGLVANMYASRYTERCGSEVLDEPGDVPADVQPDPIIVVEPIEPESAESGAGAAAVGGDQAGPVPGGDVGAEGIEGGEGDGGVLDGAAPATP